MILTRSAKRASTVRDRDKRSISACSSALNRRSVILSAIPLSVKHLAGCTTKRASHKSDRGEFQHASDAGDIHHRFTRGNGMLVVTRQAAIATQPAECAFHDPAARQDSKALGTLRPADNL